MSPEGTGSEPERADPADEPSAPDLHIREADLMWRAVDDDIVVLDGRTWEYLSVNASGRMLWEELARGATHAELVALMVQTYDIERSVAEADVQAFLSTLRDKDLLADR